MKGRTEFSGLLEDTFIMVERQYWNGDDWIGAGASAFPMTEPLQVEFGELPRIVHTCEEQRNLPCPGCQRIDV